MLIPREALAQVKTIVTHANCPDGTASAILLHDALPEAEVLFVKHGTEDFAKLPATPNMLFCDFTPPAERVQEFVDVGAIVLDHHKSARSVVEAFGVFGVFADESQEPGVSGAVLAFRHVWQTMKKTPFRYHDHAQNEGRKEANAARFAELAGIRDTFDRRDPSKWKWACAQAEVLTFYPQRDWLTSEGLTPEAFGRENEAWWADRMKLGEFLLQKNAKRTEDAIRDGFTGKTSKGTSYLILQNVGPTSDVGAATEGKVDVVVGFRYYMDGTAKLQLSLRSQGVVDVSVISKKYGGGGHTNAAGFTLGLSDADPNPIAHIRALLEDCNV